MNKKRDWGLPGGHLEDGETPDEAITRELKEECGIDHLSLERVDFFTHSGGKIVLAYRGSLDDSCELKSQQTESEGIPLWLTRSEFEQIDIEPAYREFVLSQWEN